MLAGKPTIFLSYSGRFADEVAKPIAERLMPYGFKAVLVGEEPLPPAVESNPNNKVDWYLLNSEMAVFLATPDDSLASGEIRTRQNIIDEHARAQQREHLKHKLLVFKAPDVKLPSNINPAYEQLPIDDPDWIVGKIVAQAWTWGLLAAEPTPPEEPSPQSSEEESAPTTAMPGDEDSDATGQAVAALNAAVRQLRGEAVERGTLNRAELVLAGLTIDISSDTMGVHLANKIFARRHDLQLRRSERLALVRTYLGHARDENVPGAVWLKDLSRKEIVELLTSLAEGDGDEAVRAEALIVLGKLGGPSSSEKERRLLEPFLASDEFRLRWAALDYIRARSDRRLRDLLDDPDLLERDRHRVSATAALLDLRRRPGSVLERYIEDAYIRRDEDIEKDLLDTASRINRTVVNRALRSSVPEVRDLGLRIAVRKRCLSSESANELLDLEKSPVMRLRIVRSLIATGGQVDLDMLDRAIAKREGDTRDFTGFDDLHAAEVDLGLKLPPDELEKGVQWSPTRGTSLYEAQGRRDQQWADRHVRRDLATDFERLKKLWREDWIAESAKLREEQLERSLSPTEHDALVAAIDEKLSEFATTDQFILRLFRRAALRVLVANGKPSDVRFARRFAADGDHDTRVEALRLFERFGTTHDGSTVLALVGQVYDDHDRLRAAATALRLAYKKDKLTVLATLRDTHTVRIWAVERLADVEGGVSVAWHLLTNNDADVRLAAADVVWNAIKPEIADELLSYCMRQRHFYNVVRAIDRRLYAHKWLAEALASAK